MLVSRRLPTPPSAKQASTTDRSEYEQQDDGPDRRICDRGDHACTEVDAELGQQPAAEERPDYSDNEIAESERCVQVTLSEHLRASREAEKWPGSIRATRPVPCG